MRAFNTLAAALVLAAASFAATAATACEEYVEVGADDLKAYRDKLAEAGADPLDQLFAFEALACSNKPTVRAYAIKAGLEGTGDPIVRQQIMLEAMLQKTRIDIDLVPGSSSTKDDKEFIKSVSGIWSKEIRYASAVDGCISLNRDDECRTSYSLFLRGDKVEFSHGDMRGEFQLTNANELVGYVIAYPDSRFSQIPATIRLY